MNASVSAGAAILVLVALLGVAVMITSVGLGIARIAAARVQASSAADLAALAAAPNLDCARARAVAVMNRANSWTARCSIAMSRSRWACVSHWPDGRFRSPLNRVQDRRELFLWVFARVVWQSGGSAKRRR
jgi:hypothetical protein